MTEFLATLVPALGQALLHFLWQGALIGALAALALQALREARPQLRYAVACLALLACVLAPLATLLAQWPATSAAATTGSLTLLPALDAAPTRPTMLHALAPQGFDLQPLLPSIVAMWAAGTFVMSLRIVLGLAWLRRVRNAPQSPLQPAWQARLDAIAVHFGLRRGVQLRLVDGLRSPVSAGWFRPVVLVPAGLLTRMPAELIEALLAHELAHIRRHDYLVNLLQNAVEAVLFYHPVTWWLSRRIREERELIADRLAAEVACPPRRLAVALSQLADLAETLSQPSHTPSTRRPALHLVQAAHGGPLMSRITQLVRPARPAHPGARIVFPLLGLAAACIATYTYAQPEPAATARLEVTRGAPGRAPFVQVATVAQGAPATQAAANAQATVAQVATTQVATKGKSSLTLDERDSFALVHPAKDEISMWGQMDDLKQLEATRRAMSTEFLWFNRKGQSFVVTDPALIGRAHEAMRESHAIEARMEGLEGQMEVHEKKMEVLEGRMEAISDEPSPEARKAEREMDRLGEQQEALGEKQEALAEQMEDVSDTGRIQQLSAQMEALARQQEALARQQEVQARVLEADARRMQEKQAPMEAIGKQMEEAAKPMEALGKQMEALGREQEKASEAARRAVEALIAEAQARNLARPAPATR